jgi:hypothetical protein
MTAYEHLIQALCASLQIEADADSDALVLETPDHDAFVSAQPSPSGAQGLLVRVSVRTLTEADPHDMADALKMLHRLNHDARSMSPWRIVLDADEALSIQQWCALDQIDADGLQQVLIDGLERAGLLHSMLAQALPDSEGPSEHGSPALSSHVIFG